MRLPFAGMVIRNREGELAACDDVAGDALCES